MLENRVLRKLVELKSDEVTREWSRLHNEMLNDLYCPQNNIRFIESRRMRWAGHVVCFEEKTGVYRILFGNLRHETTWKT